MGGCASGSNLAKVNDMKDKIAVRTMISRNYAAYAKTLEESIKHANPEIDFHVLVVDEIITPNSVAAGAPRRQTGDPSQHQ